jgi:predicted ribosome quality control (RQC) complex YloA/Tae2 family protein
LREEPSVRESFTSYVEARRARLEKQQAVQRLQNRIALLMKEEDLAHRKAEEARKKALLMIQHKQEREQMNSQIQAQRTLMLCKVQAQAQIIREEEIGVKIQKSRVDQRNKL